MHGRSRTGRRLTRAYRTATCAHVGPVASIGDGSRSAVSARRYRHGSTGVLPRCSG